MFETFFILMAITFIGVFICEALKSAGEALSSTSMPKKSALTSYDHKAQREAKKRHRKAAKKRAEELKIKKEKEEANKQWKEFSEKYKGIVCEEEMKTIHELTLKENKTNKETIILFLGKLRVKILSIFYRNKSTRAK